MTAWVGRPDLPADVLFAPWLDALYGDANVRRVAQALRDADVAVSAIWTEDWRGAENGAGGYQLLENWRVDRELYPDFEGTADTLHGLGFKFLTYNNTFIENRADVHTEAVENDYEIHTAAGDEYSFDGNTFMPETLLDLWNPAAVAWTKDVYREGLDLGADGWMADFGEWLPTDSVLADGSDPMIRHNRYTVEWARLNHDLQVERGGDLVFFMRSAYLHSQPLVQIVWPGDQQTDWTLGDGFPSVIPPGIGLGMAGFPYYAHDIGGYMSELTVPTTKELWWRWCELGALTPVMRTHHGRAADRNWNWESDAETTAHLARYSKLHMQLVPYLAARAEDAQATGVPIVRAIGLQYPDDTWPWVWTGTDEYLLGDRILVAPVIQEGATTRAVMLPTAELWYPLQGGPPIQGDQTVDAALGEIPAFVPEGSILVLYPRTVDTVIEAPGDASLVTAASIGDDRDVVVFAGTASRSSLGVHALRGASYTWGGRDATAAPPTTATFDGQPVTVTATPLGAIVTVDGPGTLAFEGGGTLTLAGAIGSTTVTLRL
jgi:alpha-glucosidase